MEAEQVTVTAAAKALDVSSDTIRRWHKLGLIKATRAASGKRLFNLDEIKRLQRKLSGDGDVQKLEVLDAHVTYPKATCIDLFAGAGGTALGFQKAGFNHVLLNELDPSAAATLRRNSESYNLGWNIDEGDVHELSFEGVTAEVIQAGFPCQAFSYAGKSRGFEDTRGTLFF